MKLPREFSTKECIVSKLKFRPQNGFLFNWYAPHFSVVHEKICSEKCYDIAK